MKISPMLLTAAFLNISPGSHANAAESLEVTGYVKPAIASRYLPEAVPADRLTFGLEESKAGLRLAGESHSNWQYHIYLYLTGESLKVLTHAIGLDTDNDGDTEKVFTRSTSASRNLLRDAWAGWKPSGNFQMKFGRMAVPFTSQAQANDTELMFPDRASPNAVFLHGRDLGGLAQFDAPAGIIEVQAGLFNGTGQGLGASTEEGILYALRLDFNPRGAFSRGETGQKKDSFKYGFGAGLIANPYTLYDSAGYPATGVIDLRATTSFRMTGNGFHFLTEAIGRYKTDTMRSRPEAALGAFGQTGWYMKSGLEPVFRFGWVVEDYTFSPRHIYWGEAGLNLYVHDSYSDQKPIRIGLHYMGELRFTERELGHGASMQALVNF